MKNVAGYHLEQVTPPTTDRSPRKHFIFGVYNSLKLRTFGVDRTVLIFLQHSPIIMGFKPTPAELNLLEGPSQGRSTNRTNVTAEYFCILRSRLFQTS